MSRTHAAILACLALMSVCAISPVNGQAVETDKKWHFLAEPYIMFPYMSGETGIGENLLFPVDANPGDIFSVLQAGAMLNLEAKTDRWAITSDLVYMNLKQDVTPGTLINSGEANVRQLIWEAAGLYRLTPFWEAGIGGRLNYLQSGVNAQIYQFQPGTREFSGEKDKTWYDPVIVTRLSADIKGRWLLQFRGDVGGFGIGSDLTWQLQAYAGYRFGKVFQLTGGYRILSIDYSQGEAPGEFVFDMNEFGPLIRLGFNF
jgi:hypothetical protein